MSLFFLLLDFYESETCFKCGSVLFKTFFLKWSLPTSKFQKQGLKSTYWTKKLPYFRPYLRQGHQFWAKNISDSKTMDISLKVPQISKKGKKYIKSTITWKIEILRKKNFFAIFFQKSIKSYIRYLLPLKKGKVYFRYFCNSSKKSRLFWYDLPFFSQFYENFGPKKTFFLLSRALWPPKKKGKRGKKGTSCTFPKSTSFGRTPPQILASNNK